MTSLIVRDLRLFRRRRTTLIFASSHPFQKIPRAMDPSHLRSPDLGRLGRKSAWESVFSNFGDRKTTIVVAPEVGMEFDSLQEAHDFFSMYSWKIGFSIRDGQSRRNAAIRRTGQDIVCGCTGKPRHERSRSISCGGLAMI